MDATTGNIIKVFKGLRKLLMASGDSEMSKFIICGSF